MKKIIHTALLFLTTIFSAHAQLNQQANMSAVSISAIPATIGGKGQIEVVVQNIGTEPYPPGTFLVNISIDPRYLALDSPFFDESTGWHINDSGSDYAELVNTISIEGGDAAALVIDVLTTANISVDALVAVNVSIPADMVYFAGDTDPDNNYIGGIAPLPVKLVSFTVSREGIMAQLAWKTSEEINASHFEIQRSGEGKNWLALGTRPAGARDYTFTDKTPLAGQNLYRLKMVDQDGSSAYSTIRSVNFKGAPTQVQLYPNPTSEFISFKNVEAANIKEVRILGLNGQPLLTTGKPGEKGIDIRKLTSGIYLVQLTEVNGVVSNHKLVIAK